MKTRRKLILSLFFLTLLGATIWGLWTTPSYSEVKMKTLGSDRVLLDRKGSVVQVLRTDFFKRKLPWLDLASYPPNLEKILLISEDRRFHYHPGVDPLALGRILMRALSGKSLQGASTLTMQVVDLISPEVLIEHKPIPKGSWSNKVTQIFKALLMELKWTKSEILEAYINEIHLRGEFQGFSTMSYAYFNKSPLVLSDQELALMVSLISAPNQSRDRLKRKACYLLNKLETTDCETLEPALNLVYSHQPKLPQGPRDALHLARRIFASDKTKEAIQSTLDRDLQLKVSEILARHLDPLKTKNVNDAAAIVIDNATGEVLTYVGNSSGFEDASQVDGVTALRQAGSTLKPFLYGRAFDTRILTPASIILDEPTAITWAGGVYRPTNYDKQFNGPVTAREALASSLNVPAVKIITMIGLFESYKLMQEIGLQKLQDADYYGVSMALGAVDIQLETLANAYRMVANNGVRTPLHFILNEAAGPAMGKKVFSEQTAFLLKSILSDPQARAIGFGFDSPLETPFWTAVKTGTSKGYKDNWCVGFSSKYTVGVWAGNFDSTGMHEVSGVSGAGPMWEEIMQHLHKSLPSQAPTVPSGVIEMAVQYPWSSSEVKEYFLAGSQPPSKLIEPALEKRVQIVFPAEGSVLVKNPHLEKERQALFVRFKGLVPEGSAIQWNEKILGKAVSPFKVEDPPRGSHNLSILDADKKVLAKIHFRIR